MIAILAMAAGYGSVFLDGNSLYDRCRDRAQQEICAGFVSGVNDALVTMQVAGEIKPPVLCNAPSVSVEQEVDVVVSYLRDKPEVRNQMAGGLAAAALMKAFPCQ